MQDSSLPAQRKVAISPRINADNAWGIGDKGPSAVKGGQLVVFCQFMAREVGAPALQGLRDRRGRRVERDQHAEPPPRAGRYRELLHPRTARAFFRCLCAVARRI
jgi:hypothetical protein